jgi:hypothetical protein
MKLFTAFALFLFSADAFTQAVPAVEENIPYLVTFGKQANPSWGDDDFAQTFFFTVPTDYKQPIYLRVFDPNCGGTIDEDRGGFNTITKFSVYGGDGTITHSDARQTNPIGNFRSGNLLASKAFQAESTYDGKWYTFGPFNPSEGELAEQYGGYVFKLICEGIKGDDGNLYRYFMSTQADKNIEVEGGNAFTFEYSFRLHPEAWQTSHVYPYIDDKVISLRQNNFDWDNDGFIKIYSVATLAFNLQTSNENNWIQSEYKVKADERGTSLDIQFTKNDKLQVNNNNVVFYITNQYGEFLPFWTVPIGGVPVYKGKAKVTAID